MCHFVNSDMVLLKVIMTRYHFHFSITDSLLLKLILISIHFSITCYVIKQLLSFLWVKMSFHGPKVIWLVWERIFLMHHYKIYLTNYVPFIAFTIPDLLSSFMTSHRIFNQNNTMGVTNEAGNAHPSGVPEFIPCF
jgi:hypothetical protein